MSLILYPANETAFDSNGIGILSEATNDEVYQELNGQYELTVQYPVDGLLFSEIALDAYISAKPDPVTDPQPFRIYRITKPTKGIVTIYARHVAYRLNKIVVAPFTANSAPAALQSIKSNAVNDCPFEFWTDKTTSAEMRVAVPSNVWTLLGNTRGSILDVYGGEYEFDKFMVKLHSRRGADRGVSIRYGKNLTDLKQDENISNVYTGVYPFWTDFDGNLVQLPEKVVKATGTYAEDKIKPLNLSAEFSEKPTEDQLRDRARKYIVDNEIGIPNVSWTIYFVLLEQTDEYRGKALLEQILLGDTVSVWFPKLGVNASARAVACRYKPSMSRYISITLGKVKSNIADTIAQQGQALADKPETTLIHSLMTQMTAAIVGARGGAVRLLDTDGDKYPDTLYIGDAPDPAQAKKVWRFNYEGWAVSKTGYNGPFVMAATIDKGIYADFITAGTLVGVLIKACRIESLNGKIAIDLSDESKMPVFNTGVSTNGLVVRGDAADAAEVFSLKAVKAASGYFGKMLFKSVDGTDLFQLSESFTDGELSGVVAQFLARAGLSAVINASEKKAGFWLRHDGEYKGYMIVDNDGVSATNTARLNGKNLSWVSNGDGTYHLVGTNPT